MQFLKKTNIDFMKYKYLALVLSGIIILVGVLNMSVGKGLNYGIDFAGGALVRVIFRDVVPISEVRDALNGAGLDNSRIQHMGTSEREFIIRAMPDSEAEEQDIEAHEILGSLVVDTLRGTDESAEVDLGKVDLNSVDVNGLNLLLQANYPEQAAVIAGDIITLQEHPRDVGDNPGFFSIGSDPKPDSGD